MNSTITIYVPPELKSRLGILPARGISKICQAALLAAVTAAEQERDGAVAEAFEED